MARDNAHPQEVGLDAVWHEKDLMFNSLAVIRVEKINTVKVLCFLARGEVMDPTAANYVYKISDTWQQIDGDFQRCNGQRLVEV